MLNVNVRKNGRKYGDSFFDLRCEPMMMMMMMMIIIIIILRLFS